MTLYISVATFTNAFAADASKVKDLIHYLKQNGNYERHTFRNEDVTSRSLLLSNIRSNDGYPSQSQVLISVQSQGGIESFITLEKMTAEDDTEDFEMIIDRPSTGYGEIDDAIKGRFNPQGMIVYAVYIDLRNQQSRQALQSGFDDFVERAHRKYIENGH